MTNDKSAALEAIDEALNDPDSFDLHAEIVEEALNYYRAALTPDAKDETGSAIDGPIGYAVLGDAEHETELVTILELNGQSPDEYFGHLKSIPVYTSPSQPQAVAEPIEPVAYSYELATTLGSEGYSDFEPALTRYKPCVPAGSIKNLTPLYATPPAKDTTSEIIRRAEELIKHEPPRRWSFNAHKAWDNLKAALSQGKD